MIRLVSHLLTKLVLPVVWTELASDEGKVVVLVLTVVTGHSPFAAAVTILALIIQELLIEVGVQHRRYNLTVVGSVVEDERFSVGSMHHSLPFELSNSSFITVIHLSQAACIVHCS